MIRKKTGKNDDNEVYGFNAVEEDEIDDLIIFVQLFAFNYDNSEGERIVVVIKGRDKSIFYNL
ncbi:hypothetical protein Bhyg_04796 [Pseudolycoriella hygida]|uniref:Uncharacterized protein n=1 Tax=Pseudolycoriella hygida TaxID=35572 RepID=A0A9Q0NGA8_9DIPT|nr:hypothetical protein Bhyg_04796 [Pseudolycoriella hygida]